MDNLIKIRGARQHNLKNINLDIPKNKLVVFTGVSGSGKSSLAFDTVYAEGQRRYVESLSTYARQFLGVMEKPDVDLIEGLSPAISIDQKTTSRNPRSTVGTVTEVYDYLRLLYARIGHPHCPVCGREIAGQSVDEIIEKVLLQIKEDLTSSNVARYLIVSPLVNDKKGEFTALFDNLKAKGFRHVRVDGLIYDLHEDFVLIKTNKHTIEVVVDRLSMSAKDVKDSIFLGNLKSRLSDSVEAALKLSDGLVILTRVNDEVFDMPEIPEKMSDRLFSEKFSCPVDNIQLPEIEPRTFSFNSPHGACPACSGLGKVSKVDERRIFAYEISITEGAILPFANMFENDTWYARLVLEVCRQNDIDPKTPLKNLSAEKIDILLKGTNERQYRVEGTNRFGKDTYIYEEFPGVIAELEKRHASTDSDWVRGEIEKYMREMTCMECGGARLKKEALSITVDGLSIHDATQKSVTQAILWFNNLQKEKVLSQKEAEIGNLIIKEIVTRLNFLASVGLEYLTLNRSASTLSGGEAQRIRLASQIGSGLTGVLYVLDEPTIGLHQKDNQKLIDTLKKLRDLGNSVIVVEHDEEMMRQSDWIIDFGPMAGKTGGDVVAQGNIAKIVKSSKSITGKYLSGKKTVDLANFKSDEKNAYLKNGDNGLKLDLKTKTKNYKFPTLKPQPSTHHSHPHILLSGCSQFNLKNLNIKLPLEKLVVITGVSGSGKSTLLVETLYPALQSKVNPHFKGDIGIHKSLEGGENVDKVILIDQSPIGRTPRSNPATYIKLFDHIRDVFAQTKDARLAGYKKGRFSFNVKGGRCESCEGQGQIKIEMQFMSDIWVTCDICKGRRYNSQTLEILYRGKNISDVLDMTVDEAIEYFHAHSPIIRKLNTLKAVGLNYIKLGQPATTLSGGEAQRIKLSLELSKKDTGNTVYILDEPTTGLHFYDVQKLLNVLKLLVSKNNSVYIIEHNLDVIRNADWIVDLGPEGGDGGGSVVAQGRVDDVAKIGHSYTGQYLKNITSKS